MVVTRASLRSGQGFYRPCLHKSAQGIHRSKTVAKKASSLVISA